MSQRDVKDIDGKSLKKLKNAVYSCMFIGIKKKIKKFFFFFFA